MERNDRILIVTHEILPDLPDPATGCGIRVWSLAETLQSQGFEVRIAVPHGHLLSIHPESQIHQKYVGFVRPQELDDLIRDFHPRLILAEKWETLYFHKPEGVPVLLDCSAPLCLEGMFLDEEWNSRMIGKIGALRKADGFLFPTERLKHYYLPWLLMAGFEPLRTPMATIPFAFPAELPKHQAPTEPVFLCAGTDNPWYECRPHLGRLLETLQKLGTGRLELITGNHPLDRTGRRRRLELEKSFPPDSERLEVQPLVPFPQFVERCRRATVGIDLAGHHVERELAFTVRTLNYLWCGLPVILSDRNPLAKEVQEADAGWVLPDGDGAGLDGLLAEIVKNPDFVRKRSENAQRLVRRRYTWKHLEEPLRAIVEQLEPATLRLSILAGYGERIWDDLHRENLELRWKLDQQSRETAVVRDRLARLEPVPAELLETQKNLERTRAWLVRAQDALDRQSVRLREAKLAQEAREREHEMEIELRQDAWSKEKQKRMEADQTLLGARAAQKELQLALEARIAVIRSLEQSLSEQSGELLLWKGQADPSPEQWRNSIGASWRSTRRLVRLRFAEFWRNTVGRIPARWMLLTNVRALRPVKLVFLASLTLVAYAYLHVFERIRKIRVLP